VEDETAPAGSRIVAALDRRRMGAEADKVLGTSTS
jgi:hypothetical protein